MIHINHRHTVLTSEQIRSLDEATIDKAGISGDLLMEVAGFQAAREIMRRQNGNKRGLIFCGTGNNAGDALVVARYLLRNGFYLTIHYTGGTGKFSPEAQINYDRLHKFADYGVGGGDKVEVDTETDTEIDTETEDAKRIDIRNSNRPGNGSRRGIVSRIGIEKENLQILDNPAEADAQDYDFVIDGLFGTGLNKEVTGPYREAIDRINQLGLFTYSMDIPSGLDADTGEIHGITVNANVTCTFGGLKHGFYTPGGYKLAGEVVLCELPFPPQLYPIASELCTTIHPDHTKVDDPGDSGGRHKYERGIVYVLGGSPGMTGAAILSAQAAWKSGPGAVIVISPAGLMHAFEQNLIEPVKKAVGSRDDVYFRTSHLNDVVEIIQGKPGVVLLGPGIGRHDETVKFTQELVKTCVFPLVIDADGLWCLSQGGLPSGFVYDTVLTPHPGELQQLIGRSAGTSMERLGQIRQLSQQTGAVLVGKGNPTYVTAPGSRTFLTSYDTTLFGRTGFGDVLAGTIAAFMATGYEPVEASVHALCEGFRKIRKAASEDSIPGPSDII